MQNYRRRRKDRFPKTERRKWAIRALVFIIVVALGSAVYAGTQIWDAIAKGQDELEKSKLREGQIDMDKDPFAILLIGSDARKEGGHNWRPDVLIVAAINPKKKSMKMISIPRDSYVEIANTNGGKAKINHAALYGYQHGVDPVKNTRETVENFLHIPIDYYAKVNFKGFMDSVDVLGGVDINNKKAFSQGTFGGGKLFFKLGPQHLDGEHALAYARMRKKDPRGDLGRNERQREVLNQLVDKAISLGGITKFSELTQKVGANFSYSFKPTEIPSLIAIYKSIPKKNTETLNLKVTNGRRDRQDVVLVDKQDSERISKILQEQLEWKPKNDQQGTQQTDNQE
ncbi:transcriptional attenuator, LytR family [Seinonella peptonophila]|uniref:Transcriptional attenuator, LytR family n=1 Tax=Seinonella peptonophila TaxID=112248 RepID=A0A1M4XRU5_9BACL|nr:LCP family protein [Seinonella peptonophila]SHE96165.1 transcriptional attenuator, LytR family [Seinonella peptonophila]